MTIMSLYESFTLSVCNTGLAFLVTNQETTVVGSTDHDFIEQYHDFLPEQEVLQLTCVDTAVCVCFKLGKYFVGFNFIFKM